LIQGVLIFGESMFYRLVCVKSLSTLLLTALFALPMLAQETQEAEQQQQDPKKLFANSCSWCHGNFGMKAGKGGPKLAGIAKDEEAIYNTLIKGQGAMPSFKNTLKPDEIRLLARYIKSLPNE
jgi:mono/diheme cytochrome c family protein